MSPEHEARSKKAEFQEASLLLRCSATVSMEHRLAATRGSAELRWTFLVPYFISGIASLLLAVVIIYLEIMGDLR